MRGRCALRFFFFRSCLHSKLRISYNVEFDLRRFVGLPFGAWLELDKAGKSFRVIEADAAVEEVAGDEINTRTNKEINDDRTTQALAQSDIEKMKAEGMTPQQIIQALSANSRTYDEKTVYAQQKYIKRKKKKYAHVHTVKACAACSVQRAACSVQRAACSVQRAACSVQRAACSVQRAACSVQRAACSVQRAACSVQRAACSEC